MFPFGSLSNFEQNASCLQMFNKSECCHWTVFNCWLWDLSLACSYDRNDESTLETQKKKKTSKQIIQNVTSRVRVYRNLNHPMLTAERNWNCWYEGAQFTCFSGFWVLTIFMYRKTLHSLCLFFFDQDCDILPEFSVELKRTNIFNQSYRNRNPD